MRQVSHTTSSVRDMDGDRIEDDVDEVEVTGLKIAYTRAGSGEPLVLLHGGMSDHRGWRRQIEELSDQYMVIAWDAPGCGRSTDPPETFRLPDYADSLAAFLEAIGVERTHVVGLSFGGGLALELYRRHPVVLRSLVLVSAYAGWAGSLPAEIVDQRLRQVLRESEMPPEELVRTYVPGLLTESAPTWLVDELVQIMSDFHPAGVRVMARSFAEADLRDTLPLIGVPTLLLYGEHDLRAPTSVAEELHAKIPGSKLVFVPRVGHQINMEAAGRFNAEVREFLGPRTG